MELAEFRESVSKAVSLADLLSDAGFELRTPEVEEQISCPFHGTDRRPSARHYPETNSIHCFTCHKSWDPFYFIMEKKGMRFKEAIDYIGKKYGIETSDVSYGTDGTRMIKFRKTGRREEKKTLSAEEKMFVVKGAIEDKILACKGKTDTKKYMDLVYLMSHMWGMNTEEKLLPVATKVLKSVNKILDGEVATNG